MSARTLSVSIILPISLFILIGCGTDTGKNTCVPNATSECLCVEGGSGLQECNEEGTGFKTGCQCGPVSDATGSDTTEDADPSSTQNDGTSLEDQGKNNGGGGENPWAESEDGTPCDDLNLCTTGDTVENGSCVGAIKDCDDNDQCTVDLCDPVIGFCENTPAALPCDDGDPCTTQDTCLKDSTCLGAVPLCGAAKVCHQGECLDYPTNATVCGEKECGPADFGAICGECDGNDICNSEGLCVSECTADCDGKACGPDGCGGLCGGSASVDDPCSGLPCDENGQCVSQEDCVPNCDSALCSDDGSCAAKACGSDGCGGSCGDCPEGQLCASDSFCDNSCLSLALCPSLGFETQTLIDWTYTGSAYVVPSLGEATPPEGKAMLHLSTKKGNNGEASKMVLMPEDTTGFEVSWRFYSEEFLAWCSSGFQDDFAITLTVDDQPLTVVSHSIKEICPKSECDGCQGLFPLELSDIHFDQGEAYRTPWIRSTLAPPNADFGGKIALIEIKISDVGDGIFESHLLVDDLGFIEDESVESKSVPIIE